MFLFNKNNRRLVETALGNRPADLVIKNGVLVDVYKGCLTPNRSVAISGKWIAYVGPDAGFAIGKKTKVIEANGRVISPGYIDPHSHIVHFFDIADFIKYAIPGGTTTYVTEVESLGFCMGADGLEVFLEQVRNRPVKILCLIPPLVSVSPISALSHFTLKEIKKYLKDEMVAGLGESYWQNTILTKDNRVLHEIRETVRTGKSVEGHAAGAADRKLAAYAAAGAVSCHEAVTSEDIQNRLEMGFGIFLREGYIRRDLESIRSLIGKIDLRRCMLCTDGIDPETLLSRGYFFDIVQKAVDIGIEPVEAIRMATLNTAEHLHLDHLIGGVSPGRYADILILPEPHIMKPDIVISEGIIAAEQGICKIENKRVPYPERSLNTVKVPLISPVELAVSASACSKPGTVRTMDIQSNGLVVKEGSTAVISVNGQILPSPEEDLSKIVFIDRVSGKAEKFVGFLRGWGMKDGAAASSLAWDCAGIVAVGANDIDLAKAINRVIENRGGSAIALNGEIKVDIPLPIGGFISSSPIEDTASRVSDFHRTAVGLGFPYNSAHLTLLTLTSAAIPFMRITEKGYYRFREDDYVGL